MRKKSICYKVGIGFIALSFISPLIGLLVPFFGLPVAITAMVVTFFMLGGPEIFLIIGGVLAGKEVVVTIKTKLFDYASKRRYQIGAVLFFGSLIISWPLIYIEIVSGVNWSHELKLILVICIDVITLVGILLMGPEFFDKIKRLFIWEGKTL